MRLITLLDCLAVMVMEEINILPWHRLSRMASALGLEKAFAKAADPRTSSLEGALVPVGRHKNVSTAWHTTSHLIITCSSVVSLALFHK